MKIKFKSIARKNSENKQMESQTDTTYKNRRHNYLADSTYPSEQSTSKMMSL